VFGYRGFLVRLESDKGIEEEVRVFRGIVERGTAFFMDEDRRLERWLLETAGDSLAPELQDLVRSELQE
jgi:hypothetical protein